MESKPLSQLHIITEVNHAFDPGTSDSIFNSFVFNVQDAKATDAVFRQVFATENTAPFTLTLQLTKLFQNPITGKWFDELCLILCHPDYIKQNEQPILGVLYNEKDLRRKDEFLRQLHTKLKAQGFDQILVTDLVMLQPEEPINLSYTFYKHTLETTAFYTWYLHQLTKAPSLLNIFIPYTNNLHIATFLSEQQQAEKHLIANEPLVYRFILQLQNKEAELQQYKALVRALTEDLSSKKAYLDFLLGKFKEGGDNVDLNEIMKIKKFYHREYEVLPLWYKRFGHLIKVVSGKRTFKSLFNDNLKER